MKKFSNRILKNLSAFFMMAIFLNYSAGLFAYNYFSCAGSKVRWIKKDPTMVASEISFPSGSPFRDALSKMISRLGENPSQFYFKKKYDNSKVSFWNYESEIWASDTYFSDTSLVNAGAKNRVACPFIHASDIIFNAKMPWSLSYDENGHYVYFQNTALHELGHALGLAHGGGTYNVMNYSPHHHTNGDKSEAYFGEDSSEGAVFLYGLLNVTPWDDLSVVSYKYSGYMADPKDGGGPIGFHWDTDIYDEQGSLLSKTPQGFLAKPGQKIRVEFSYENSGKQTWSNISMGYYLSTNSVITTSDQLLKTKKYTLKRNVVATTKEMLTVPNLPDGVYWIGVIIDNNDNIKELREDNNAAYLPIKICTKYYHQCL